MADMRVTSGLPATTAAPGASPVARATQRAFFDAALTKTGATTAVASQSVAMPEPARTRVQVERIAPETPPSGRVLRPGSFLDIKV